MRPVQTVMHKYVNKPKCKTLITFEKTALYIYA